MNPMLVNCPRCKRGVSGGAATCPHCGSPIATAALVQDPSTQATPALACAPTRELRLGNLVSEHRVGVDPWVVFGLGIVIIATGAVTLVVPVVGVPVLGLGVYVAVLGYRRIRCSARLYEKGFVYTARGAEHWVAWEDVEAVRYSETRYTLNLLVPAGTRHRLEVEVVGGNRFTLDDDLRGVARLSEQIRQRSLGAWLASAKRRISEGETLAFGPFSLSLAGVHSHRGVLGWRETWHVKTDDNFVSFFTLTADGKALVGWVEAEMMAVRDYEVFLTILAQMHEPTGTQSS